MKYRGYKRNIDGILPCDQIRSLSKDQIEKNMVGCEYLGQILNNLNIDSDSNKRRILFSRMEELKIDFSHLRIESDRFKDLTGSEFGHLIVLRRAPTTLSGHTMWVCREKETNIEKIVASTHLLRGNTKSFSIKKIGDKHPQWKGVGKISGDFWNKIKNGAFKRKIEFAVTIQYVWDLFLIQNAKCALSKKDIYFPESNKSPYTASLDRIDSSKGYIEGNIQWVHTKINIMKNKFDQTEFIDFCKSVAENSYLK